MSDGVATTCPCHQTGRRSFSGIIHHLLQHDQNIRKRFICVHKIIVQYRFTAPNIVSVTSLECTSYIMVVSGFAKVDASGTAHGYFTRCNLQCLNISGSQCHTIVIFVCYNITLHECFMLLKSCILFKGFYAE